MLKDAQDEYDILDNKYNLIKKIGTGATATVKLAKDIETSQNYAIKFLKDNDDKKIGGRHLHHFNSEIETLKKLKHENIINLIESGTGTVKKLNGITKKKNFIVLEYAANCELFDFIYFPRKGFGEQISRGLFKQLLLGLDSCHKAGIAHRDLKTENLMLTYDWQLKIADFGYATYLEGKKQDGVLTTFLGTLSYASPEIIGKKFYKGAPSDIFSCGVILYILVTGKLPFGKASMNDAYYRNFIRNDPDNFWKVIEPKLGGIHVSNEFKSIINRIFTYDTEKRITIEELMEHEWMKLSMPTSEEISKELESRKSEVEEMKELEQRAEEQKKSGKEGVYRSVELCMESCNYYDKIQRNVKDYTNTSNPYKVIIKDKNQERLYYNLITYFDKELTNDKTITKDNCFFKFNVKFDLDKETKELIHENDTITIEGLEIQIEIKKVKEDEFIIEWSKLKGDKMEFFEIFQQFVSQF